MVKILFCFMRESFSCIYICVLCTGWLAAHTGQRHLIPRTGVTDSCEGLCGCPGSNRGSLEEQQVLFTAESEPQGRRHFHPAFCSNSL